MKGTMEESGIDKEVKKCFDENPDLIGKSPKQLAAWFFMQGQLYLSNGNEAMRQKFIHYSKHLTDDQKKRADKSWQQMAQ